MTSRIRNRILIAVGVAAVTGLVLFLQRNSSVAEGIPYVPSKDSEVLETLSAQSSAPSMRRLAAMRRRLQADPNNLELATLLAQLNIEQSRERADPRYLGYAQAALTPWWNLPQPPPSVLILRATIRQSSHDFDGALADIDQVLQLSSDDPQAWLTRSVILIVQGKYEEARKSCEPLVQLVASLVSEVCFSTLDSLQGQAKHAYARLSRAIENNRRPGTAEENWALSTLAEIAVRAGDFAAAERHFQWSLTLDPSSAYVLGAYADLLLDLGRPQEVVRLLQQQTQNDSLLLRLAIAESQLSAPLAKSHIETLRSRFEASHMRGDTVHRREESRFELLLNGAPRAALELAQANWNVQREPWDARVLLEAALATRNPSAAAPALAAIQTSGLEEPRIRGLMAKLRGMEP
jgi:tetratricopeptide (TPR) repeat protein